jgi:hypothetical protein
MIMLSKGAADKIDKTTHDSKSLQDRQLWQELVNYRPSIYAIDRMDGMLLVLTTKWIMLTHVD